MCILRHNFLPFTDHGSPKLAQVPRRRGNVESGRVPHSRLPHRPAQPAGKERRGGDHEASVLQERHLGLSYYSGLCAAGCARPGVRRWHVALWRRRQRHGRREFPDAESVCRKPPALCWIHVQQRLSAAEQCVRFSAQASSGRFCLMCHNPSKTSRRLCHTCELNKTSYMYWKGPNFHIAKYDATYF